MDYSTCHPDAWGSSRTTVLNPTEVTTGTQKVSKGTAHVALKGLTFNSPFLSLLFPNRYLPESKPVAAVLSFP